MLLALVASAAAQPVVPPAAPVPAAPASPSPAAPASPSPPAPASPSPPVDPAAPPAPVDPAAAAAPVDPVAATPPVDPAAAAPAVAAPPPPPPWIVRGGSTYFGVELGVGSSGDTDNAFASSAIGKALVLRVRGIEMRYEAYDVEMRDPMVANAAFAKGRFTSTSVGKRFELGGRLAGVRVLAGVAYVRRPSIAVNVDDISSEVILRHQHGLAAVLGGGVQLLRYITVEARVYPTMWTDNTGDTRYAYVDGQPTMVTLTEKTGGMPMTLTAGVGVSW